MHTRNMTHVLCSELGAARFIPARRFNASHGDGDALGDGIAATSAYSSAEAGAGAGAASAVGASAGLFERSLVTASCFAPTCEGHTRRGPNRREGRRRVLEARLLVEDAAARRLGARELAGLLHAVARAGGGEHDRHPRGELVEHAHHQLERRRAE